MNKKMAIYYSYNRTVEIIKKIYTSSIILYYDLHYFLFIKIFSSLFGFAEYSD